MALNPINILKGVLDGYILTVAIDSIDSLGGGSYKLNTEQTYYLRTLKKVTIDGTEYKVTDFSINSYITVEATSGADVAVVASSFTIDQPLFVWGNPKMVSAEIVKRITNHTISWPYIWAVEVSNTQRSLDPATATPYTPSYNLIFLDSADVTNWTISDHYDNAVYTLNNYIDTFIAILKSRRDLFDTDSIDFPVTNHVNFGEYIVDEGMSDRIINDNVTGIQAQISIPLTITACRDIDLTPNCNPATETFNGSSITSIPSGGSKAIVVQNDSVGTPQVGTILLDTATNLTISVPAAGISPAQTGGLYKTGRVGQVNSGDDGALERGLGSDWWNLGYDNPMFSEHQKRFFGTTGGYYNETLSQYEDKDGNSTTEALAFPDEIILDAATYNAVNEDCLAVRYTPLTSGTHQSKLTSAPYTVGSFGDFYVCNWQELMQFWSEVDTPTNNNGYMWSPFNESLDGAVANRIMSSTPTQGINYRGIVTFTNMSGTLGQTQVSKAFIGRYLSKTDLGI